jgi:hypothetical protein
LGSRLVRHNQSKDFWNRAMVVMGRSANGWIEWKADNGKTLDELKRRGVGLAN